MNDEEALSIYRRCAISYSTLGRLDIERMIRFMAFTEASLMIKS